jgi:hypothetical protein
MRRLTMVLLTTWAVVRVGTSIGSDAVEAGGSNEPVKTIYPCSIKAEPRQKEPISLQTGPHLFVDDYLIADSCGLKRTMHQPKKLPEPVLRRGESWHLQPQWLLKVVRDAHSGSFRAWYNVKNPGGSPPLCHAYSESGDGITWQHPALGLVAVAGAKKNSLIDAPGHFGLVAVDEGPGFRDPSRRYKMAYFVQDQGSGKDGFCVAFSADGMRYRSYEHNPVLPQNAKDGSNVISDIVEACWDPLKGKYLLNCKLWRKGYPGKPHHADKAHRRCVATATSTDFVTWDKPRLIMRPDPHNGLEEFYGCKPIVRGNLYLGFLRVLRDDLPATPGGPVEGIGWTELATSRDGQNWTRYQEPFIDRDTRPCVWDHAMAWYADDVTVGDKEYIYYGGYSAGHKVGDREVGLAMLRKNGFVSRDAGSQRGLLRTPPVLLRGTSLTVNACVCGTMRVRLLDVTGKPIPGFDMADCRPIQGDGITLPVLWTGSLAAVKDKPVRIEFQMKDSQLYAFDVAE